MWQTILERKNSKLNRENESLLLFSTVKNSYECEIIDKRYELPTDVQWKSIIECDSKNYKDYLIENLKKIVQKSTFFTSNNLTPAMVLKGGLGNISYRYFDIRNFFEKNQRKTFKSISKANLMKCIKILKIQSDLILTLNILEISEIASKSIYDKLRYQLNFLYIDITFDLFKKKLEKIYQNSFERMILGFFEKIFDEGTQIYNCNFWFQYLPPCVINFRSIPEQNKEFIITDKFDELVSEFLKKNLGLNQLKQKIFDDAINWKEIGENFKQMLSKMTKINTLTKDNFIKINNEFLKFNFKFEVQIDTLVQCLTQNQNDSSNLKTLLEKNLQIIRPCFSSVNDLETKKTGFFQYLDVISLLNYVETKPFLNEIDIPLGENLLFEWEPQGKYKHIDWLNWYVLSKSEFLKRDSTNNQHLISLVNKTFEFDKFYQDIYECVLIAAEDKNSFSPQLMCKISREINNIIGEANLGLQQVSLKFNYSFVNYLHLFIVHLIWKTFEEPNFMKKMEPIKIFDNKKEQQLEYFLKMTSNDNKSKMLLEAHSVGDKIFNFLKDFNQEKIKKKILDDLEIKFKNKNNRKTIQEQIDRYFFSDKSQFNEKEIINYILSPEKKILEKYELLNKEYAILGEEKLSDQKEIFNFLKELINRIKKISANFLNIFKKEDYSYNEFFKMNIQKQENSQNFLSKIQMQLTQIAYKIVIDLIEGNQLNEYSSIDIDKINFRCNEILTQMDFGGPISLVFPEGHKLFLELKQKKIELIEPAHFLICLKKNLEEIIENFEKSFLNFEDSEKSRFKEKISISICKQKCPFCSRICGEDDQSHKYHRCVFGHQIRAIGGVVLDNGDASVSRCEDIADDEIIKFNGNKITWLECKNMMEKIENNPWKFDDLLNTAFNEETKRKFNIAWEMIGSQICSIRSKEKNINIKYVPFNHAIMQQIKQPNPEDKNHYIFIIDTSGNFFYIYF